MSNFEHTRIFCRYKFIEYLRNWKIIELSQTDWHSWLSASSLLVMHTAVRPASMRDHANELCIRGLYSVLCTRQLHYAPVRNVLWAMHMPLFRRPTTQHLKWETIDVHLWPKRTLTFRAIVSAQLCFRWLWRFIWMRRILNVIILQENTVIDVIIDCVLCRHGTVVNCRPNRCITKLRIVNTDCHRTWFVLIRFRLVAIVCLWCIAFRSRNLLA